MTITISWFSRSLMDVVSIFVRLWVAISMVLLLNMDISRAISRLSRSLAISMVICLWMINLNLVVRVRPVDILVAITTMAISSLSRSLLVIMLNLISIRSMIMITVLVNIRVSMSMMITISRLSRSLVITSIAISLNSLGTSVIVAYARGVTITRLSGSLAIISFSKSLSSSVDMAVSSIPITRLSLPLAIIPTVPSQALGAPVLRAVPTIRMIGHGIDTVTISIPGLSCTQAGKSYDCCNLSCHGYKCTKLSQIAMYPHVLCVDT